jgi:2-(1,2-epoxy-1,2-dihydrophenyl)acetyl-CoA isomerase
MTNPLNVVVSAGVAVVELNRPDTMNALDLELKTSLLKALKTVADDQRIRAVVLTGTGRAFSVGQDLRELQSSLHADPVATWDTVRDHYSPIAELIATMPKPVIAAVNGVAAGAGAALTFLCDYRIAADSAGFNLAFAGIGLSADSGTTWSLPRLVGAAKAKELLLRPRTIPAVEAQRLGLVTEVVPAEELAARARELAEEFARGPTLAYGAIRRAVAYSSAQSLHKALVYETKLMRETGTSPDHREAVDAFLDKRRPVFTGSAGSLDSTEDKS